MTLKAILSSLRPLPWSQKVEITLLSKSQMASAESLECGTMWYSPGGTDMLGQNHYLMGPEGRTPSQSIILEP